MGVVHCIYCGRLIAPDDKDAALKVKLHMSHVCLGKAGREKKIK